jgi:hypothetical protein
VKNDLYEITGISDIIRGSSKASETATAQELKGQYASLRLNHMQGDVSKIARDMVRIMAEIIAEHFSIDTIKQVSGIKLLTKAEKQQIEMQQQQVQQQAMMAQQQGQQAPPPPELPEEMQELLGLPTWEEIEALIRDDAARCFRIDIETDSTIKTDQEAEKAARVELLGAAGNFIQQMTNVDNPEIQPLLMEMLMFGVRGFKVSRELETTFDSVLNKMRKTLENPAPPPPDPKAQADAQKVQMEGARMQQDGQMRQAEMQQTAQIKQAELAAKSQIETQRIQLDNSKIQVDAELRQQELQSNAQIKSEELRLKAAEIQLRETEIKNNLLLEIERMRAEIATRQIEGQQDGEQKDNGSDEVLKKAIENMTAALAELNRPKEIVRDANGNISGIK